MSYSSVLDDSYPPGDGRTTPARLKRKRKSKLEKHRTAIEKWLLNRAEADNKQKFSQRILVAKLLKEHGLKVSQAALSRFCMANGWGSFFHE